MYLTLAILSGLVAAIGFACSLETKYTLTSFISILIGIILLAIFVNKYSQIVKAPAVRASLEDQDFIVLSVKIKSTTVVIEDPYNSKIQYICKFKKVNPTKFVIKSIKDCSKQNKPQKRKTYITPGDLISG